MTLWDLTGVQGAENGYIGKRFAYARRKSKKGIDYSFLYEIMHDIGLSKYAPRQPVATDAFRRACQSIAKGYITDQESGKKYKINMILIDESADPILRNIQLTEIDKRERSSSDGKLVAQLIFNRGTEHFTRKLGYNAGYEFEDCPSFVRERIEEAIDQYEIEKHLVSDMQIHTIIQKILYNAGNPVNGIPSTWNIPATREELLDKLLAFAERLNQFEEGIFIVDTLPVISSEETVTKVKSDAMIFAIERLNQALDQAKNSIVSSKDTEKVKEQSRIAVQKEADKVMSLVEEYEGLLGEAMDEVRQARELVEQQLKEFASSPVKQTEYRNAKRKIRSDSKKTQDSTPIISQPTRPVRKIRAASLSEAAAM